MLKLIVWSRPKRWTSRRCRLKALEGTPQTVAEQLDALGFPPDSGADALNAQAVLTVREGRAGRKALAEGGQADPSLQAAGAGLMKAGLMKAGLNGHGAGEPTTGTASAKPPRVRGVIVPSSGAAAPNGPQARLDQGGYMRLRDRKSTR